MQLIVAVLVVRAIIGMLDKNEKNNVESNDPTIRIIHPAEFEVR